MYTVSSKCPEQIPPDTKSEELHRKKQLTGNGKSCLKLDFVLYIYIQVSNKN